MNQIRELLNKRQEQVNELAALEKGEKSLAEDIAAAETEMAGSSPEDLVGNGKAGQAQVRRLQDLRGRAEAVGSVRERLLKAEVDIELELKAAIIVEFERSITVLRDAFNQEEAGLNRSLLPLHLGDAVLARKSAQKVSQTSPLRELIRKCVMVKNQAHKDPAGESIRNLERIREIANAGGIEV